MLFDEQPEALGAHTMLFVCRSLMSPVTVFHMFKFSDIAVMQDCNWPQGLFHPFFSNPKLTQSHHCTAARYTEMLP